MFVVFYTMVEKNQVNICSQIESIPLICSMSVNPCHLVLTYCTRKSAASSSDILVHACLFTRRCMFRQTRAHSSQNLDKDQLKTAGCLTSVKIVIAASSFVVLLRFARCGNNEVKKNLLHIRHVRCLCHSYFRKSGSLENN